MSLLYGEKTARASGAGVSSWHLNSCIRFPVCVREPLVFPHTFSCRQFIFLQPFLSQGSSEALLVAVWLCWFWGLHSTGQMHTQIPAPKVQAGPPYRWCSPYSMEATCPGWPSYLLGGCRGHLRETLPMLC